MTTYQTIKRAQLFLTPEHIGFLKSISSIIALYRRIKWRTAQDQAENKLLGYLMCLENCGFITDIERELLYKYYSTKNRLQEYAPFGSISADRNKE